MANGYSSESTHQELSNEYQHDSVQMFFKNICILVLWEESVFSIGRVKNSPVNLAHCCMAAEQPDICGPMTSILFSTILLRTS